MEINSNIYPIHLDNFYSKERIQLKTIGSVRQIDKLGRLVLPVDMRKALNLIDGVDSVEFVLEGDEVKIKKYRPSCVFCGFDDKVINYKNQTVCQTCLDELKSGKI